MVDALDAAVGGGLVCAGVDLIDTKAAVVDGVRELGAKLLGVVGDNRHRSPREGKVFGR